MQQPSLWFLVLTFVGSFLSAWLTTRFSGRLQAQREELKLAREKAEALLMALHEAREIVRGKLVEVVHCAHDRDQVLVAAAKFAQEDESQIRFDHSWRQVEVLSRLYFPASGDALRAWVDAVREMSLDIVDRVEAISTGPQADRDQAKKDLWEKMGSALERSDRLGQRGAAEVFGYVDGVRDGAFQRGMEFMRARFA